MAETSGEGGSQQELTTQGFNTGDKESWYDRPHGDLVQAFRHFIEEERNLHRPPGRLDRQEHQEPASEIMRSELDRRSRSTKNERKKEFFSTLRFAWDALAYDSYEPGSSAEDLAGATLQMYHGHHRAAGEEEPTIKLTDPLQVRIIDALAEAADVPHKMGQSEFKIDERHKNRSKWLLSKEYQERVDAAKAKREKAGPVH